MKSDPVLQAILLLCSYFSKDQGRDLKPLTPTEYSRLAAWLHQRSQTPADLLTKEKRLVEQWQDPKGAKGKITQDRLSGLLRRSASMGFALEKWQQQNLWILSRADYEYPKVLKEKFGDTRSPLLYCIGNKELLSAAGIGFVGSRTIDKADTDFTQTLARQAVEQGFVVVSGGAKGVDQTSMIAALEAGGSAIGVLADSLLRAATRPQYRNALKEGRLLLLTPYYPEAGFSPGNAMGRNKYIYVLSKGVVVAKSDEKGGTWSGATENLKKQWVPLWVRELQHAGNRRLIELGGQPLASDNVDFQKLLAKVPPILKPPRSLHAPEIQDLFSETDVSNEGMYEAVIQKATKVPREKGFVYEDVNVDTNRVDERANKSSLSAKPPKSLGLFIDLFYQQLKEDSQTVHTPDALLDKYPELRKPLVSEWLKCLASEGLLKRQGRKLAFTVIEKKGESESAEKQ